MNISKTEGSVPVSRQRLETPPVLKPEKLYPFVMAHGERIQALLKQGNSYESICRQWLTPLFQRPTDMPINPKTVKRYMVDWRHSVQKVQTEKSQPITASSTFSPPSKVVQPRQARADHPAQESAISQTSQLPAELGVRRFGGSFS